MNDSAKQLATTGLAALGMVCLTVLAALGKIDTDLVVNLLIVGMLREGPGAARLALESFKGRKKEG